MANFADELSKAKRLRLAPEAKNIRILTIDIESKPHAVYTWGLWDQNISIQQIIEPGGMICFAAKWMGEKEVIFKSVHHDGYEAMVRSVWALLSEADVIITYNGIRYDVKRINDEFVLSGLPPTRPYKHIDLMRANKASFDLPSRKLDWLAQQTGVGKKAETGGFQLWLDCMAGDDKAWATMRRYNIQDVVVTEKSYLRILPWITGAPHMGMFTAQGGSCPYCGSTKLERDGLTHTNVQSYYLFRCTKCQGWSRGTTTLQDPTRTRAIR